mmetsp:Transcript_111488/g.296299  ORF Transcript_111488/g.296299 Transcript_111488/m.296299 type:complete len:255 (-) Transcript_111488:56-820(-)
MSLKQRTGTMNTDSGNIANEAGVDDTKRFSGAASEVSTAADSLGADVGFMASAPCLTVLQTAPGAPKQGPDEYINLTPWVSRLFFVHTYYAYVYVFYMFVLAFYKGYALQYPDWLRWVEMVLIMALPILQHLRFFFGYWGCELGMFYDLCIFVFLCGITMLVLMYFLFFQAYLTPLDTTFIFIAVALVAVEGVCGAINALQTIKLQYSTYLQLFFMAASVMLLLAAVSAFVVRELLPKEMMNVTVQEVVWESRN